MRLEVIEKPAGGEPTTWSFRYIPNKGQGHGCGCIGISAYKEAGVYEQDIAMTKSWQNNDIVWSEGIKQMDLVIKDGTGTKSHTRPDPEKFFPTKVRMTLIQVSAGEEPHQRRLVIWFFGKIGQKHHAGGNTLPRRPSAPPTSIQRGNHSRS